MPSTSILTPLCNDLIVLGSMLNGYIYICPLSAVKNKNCYLEFSENGSGDVTVVRAVVIEVINSSSL